MRFTQALFDACFKILSPPDAPKLTIQELENELILLLSTLCKKNSQEQRAKKQDRQTDRQIDKKT